MGRASEQLTIHCMAPGSLMPLCGFARTPSADERYEVTVRALFDRLLPGAPRCQDCLEWRHA